MGKGQIRKVFEVRFSGGVSKMKTFDISKNIILAFIILISVALKLSAHENITLIGSANVPIEKDKNEENISKRKVQNKTILCYERNKKGIFDKIPSGIYVVIGAFCGACITLLGSVFLEKKRKINYLKAIKTELEGNRNNLAKKFKNVFKELLENDLSKLKEVKKTICFDFSSEEFEQKLNTNKKLNIKTLCEQIGKTKYDIPLLKENFITVDCLNKLLEVPNFYNILHKTKQGISFSDHIIKLVEKTKDYREKDFLALKDDEQYYIKRLNRFLLEKTYQHEIPKIQETRLTEILNKDYFIHLSDFSWNQYKYVISDKDKNNKISEAYMLIGNVNTLVHASFYKPLEETLPILAKAIIEAKETIERAIKELNLLTRSCCVKLANHTKNE
jgi:hypothetical protein